MVPYTQQSETKLSVPLKMTFHNTGISLWWNTYRPNFTPPPPLPSSLSEKNYYKKNKTARHMPRKKKLEIYYSIKKKILLRSHSCTPSPPPTPLPSSTRLTGPSLTGYQTQIERNMH